MKQYLKIRADFQVPCKCILRNTINLAEHKTQVDLPNLSSSLVDKTSHRNAATLQALHTSKYLLQK